MKRGTLKLNAWSDDGKPHRNTKTGNLVATFSPRVRLLSPYVLVADRAAQSKSGLTHLATLVTENGAVRLDPMTECGMNTALKPQPMAWVKGPVRIGCRRCTIIALLTLAREGRLPGCSL